MSSQDDNFSGLLSSGIRTVGRYLLGDYTNNETVSSALRHVGVKEVECAKIIQDNKQMFLDSIPEMEDKELHDHIKRLVNLLISFDVQQLTSYVELYNTVMIKRDTDPIRMLLKEVDSLKTKEEPKEEPKTDIDVKQALEADIDVKQALEADIDVKQALKGSSLPPDFDYFELLKQMPSEEGQVYSEM